jgi:hypothetical protein
MGEDLGEEDMDAMIEEAMEEEARGPAGPSENLSDDGI